MSKRLLHIVDSLAPSEVAQQLLLLAKGLSASEFDLHVCALRGGPMADELLRAGIDACVIPHRLPLDPFALVQLKRHMRSLHPSLVQTWPGLASTSGRLAAIAAGVPRLVAVERRLDAWHSWPQWQLMRGLARRTDCIVFNSAAAQAYHAARHVRPRASRIIADGVTAAVASTQTRADLLEELELPSGACLIAARAPLETHSRHKDLVWAIDILKWLYEDVHLLILGEGSQRRSLLRYVDCVEVEDCVHFLGARANAAEIVASCDFYWDASVRGGAALPLLAAMAAGVPVVAIDSPRNREAITPGETGFLVDPEDRPAYARWTHRMLSDPALRQRVAAAGQQSLGERFSCKKLVASYCGLYRELLM